MLDSGNRRAAAASLCVVREAFCRTKARRGPVYAPNRLAVANSSFATVLAHILQPSAAQRNGLLTPAYLAETVAVLVAGRSLAHVSAPANGTLGWQCPPRT